MISQYNAVESYYNSSKSTFFRIQKMESFETETGDKKSVLSHYYYINYKSFVNVVKFKLNKMRERIQADELKVCLVRSVVVHPIGCL